MFCPNKVTVTPGSGVSDSATLTVPTKRVWATNADTENNPAINNSEIFSYVNNKDLKEFNIKVKDILVINNKSYIIKTMF